MSTSAVHVTPTPTWKQEVNRRLAEHKDRKGGLPPEPRHAAGPASAASVRAHEAAARVAARYAKAPSYSEMLAAEARAALRAAEAASQAALEATTAMQNMLAGIESASVHPSAAELEAQVMETPLAQPFATDVEPMHMAGDTATDAQLQPWPHDDFMPEPVSVRWAQDLPARPQGSAAFHAGRGEDLYGEEHWRPASAEPMAPGAGDVDVVEGALPIPGNVIQFPRELVAPRKARPRLAETPFSGAEPSAQLSIFEVDPALLPEETTIQAAEPAGQSWTVPTWSGMQLDAQPAESPEIELEEPAFGPATAPEVEPAAMSRRIMAAVVDGVLVCGGVLAAAATALHNARAVPAIHTAEIGLALALLVAASLYQALFFALGRMTPGMKYARLRLSTFEGETPTRAQRCSRLIATPVAVLPAGLGVLWSLFDDHNLGWHDRLSRTYLRNA